MRYSVESTDRIFIKSYGFLYFAKTMVKNMTYYKTIDHRQATDHRQSTHRQVLHRPPTTNT